MVVNFLTLDFKRDFIFSEKKVKWINSYFRATRTSNVNLLLIVNLFLATDGWYFTFLEKWKTDNLQALDIYSQIVQASDQIFAYQWSKLYSLTTKTLLSPTLTFSIFLHYLAYSIMNSFWRKSFLLIANLRNLQQTFKLLSLQS